MAVRASEAEIELRIQEIMNAVIQGANYHDIVNMCKSKWNVTSTRTVTRYISIVKERICENGKATMEYNKSVQTTRYQKLMSQLTPMLFKNGYALDDKGKRILDENGKPVMTMRPNDSAIRLYLMTCRRLDRIQGTESITHKFEGMLNHLNVDMKLTEEDEKAYEQTLREILGGGGNKKT